MKLKVILITLICSHSLLAAETKKEPRGWVNFIGGGVAAFERTKGSDKKLIYPVPFFGFSYEGKDESYSFGPMGGNYSPLQTTSYGFGLQGIPSFGQRAEGKFKKVSPTLEMGPFAYYVAFDVLPLNLGARCDVLQLGHKGCLIDFSIPLDIPVSDQLNLQFVPVLTWGGENYMRASYNEGEGLEMFSVTLGLNYKITKSLSIAPSYTYISRLERARRALEGLNQDTNAFSLLFIHEY